MRSRSSQVAFALIFLVSLTACRGAPRPALTPGSPSFDPVRQLRRDIDSALRVQALERSSWSILVRSLKDDQVFYALNERKLMMPASTMKLVTVAAAAEHLGWDYTYETSLVLSGAVDAGVLKGDLVVVGSGDPGIVERDGMAAALFAAWADRIKEAGILAIDGRIVGDGRAFQGAGLGFGWSWDDLTEGFAAAVSGLQYNENRAQLIVVPAFTPGGPPSVTIEPAGTGLSVTNRVRSVRSGEPTSLKASRLPGSSRIELSGAIAAGGDARVLNVSVDNPPRFFASALRNALVSGGIPVSGPAVEVEEITEAGSPNDGTTLLVHRSPPLSTLLLSPMKFSVNLYEETLLKTLGATTGTPTFEAGRAVVRSVLDRWNVPAGEILQLDGSGLSRYSYVTAAALVSVLAHVDRDARLREPFEESLPVAGWDGTLAGRMTGTAAEGNVRAKTGSMSSVRTLAGYVTTPDGDRLAFAILANNFEVPGDMVTRVIDGIAARLAEFTRR